MVGGISVHTKMQNNVSVFHNPCDLIQTVQMLMFQSFYFHFYSVFISPTLVPKKPVFAFDGAVGARNVTLSWRRPSCDADNRGRVLNHILELRKEGAEGNWGNLLCLSEMKRQFLSNVHTWLRAC